MKRKIAVILAADIAGYSRLIAEDEEETLRRFEGYRAVFTDFVDRAGGRIFNTAGDAILAEFQSAVEAVRCAVDVQESLKARNLAYPPSRHMNFRIGITIGDVVEREGGDLLGDGVNIAARLESVAPPGGICVSRSVHEAVASKMALRFADAGPQALKNIPERIHAYTLTVEEGEPASVVTEVAGEAPPRAKPPPAADRQSQWITAGLAVLALAVAGAYVYEYMPRALLEMVGLGTSEPLPLDDGEAAAPPSDTSSTIASPEPEATPSPEPPSLEAESPRAAEVEPAAEPETPGQTDADKEIETAARTLDPEPGSSVPVARNPLASRYVLTRQWNDCHESDTPDVAIDACKRLLETSGLGKDDLATIHYKYGRALRNKGEPDTAIAQFELSIENRPTAEAYNYRAISYFDKGENARAIADLTEAVRLEPSFAEAINNRAWIYYKQGELSLALQDANRAVQLDGTKAYIWDTRGHIHEARGARSAAISDYRKALDLDASSESSSDGLRRLGVETN